MRVPAAVVVISFSLTAACASTARMDTDADAAVRARSEAVARAEAAQDADAAIAFWAQDAIAQLGGSPQVQGRSAILAMYRQFFGSGMLKEMSGKTSGLQIARSGDLAYEWGVNRMILAGPSGDLVDNGKYLAVWKKIDGEWYVAALSATSDAPAPVPVN